jgi:parallel beta-helix repeat protein
MGSQSRDSLLLIYRSILAIALVLAVGGALSPATAVTYYVGSTGNDNNPGTETAPWATIQWAAETMGPGDDVRVSDGVYGGFQTVRGGTASAPITFSAIGDNVIINSRNRSTPDCINIENHDWIVIQGFKIQQAPRVGIRVVESADVLIRDNEITHCGLDAILCGFAMRVQIIDNVCANSRAEHGIYVSNSHGPNDNPVLIGNRCYGNGRSGIQFNGDCWAGGDGTIDNGIIEGNIIYNNKIKGISLISARNFTVHNNVIYDNYGGAAGIHVTDEPDCNKPSIGVIVNNTIVEPKIACVRITDNSVNNRIFNNVVVGPVLSKIIVDEVGASDVDRKSNIKRTSAAGLFVDPAQRNYRLADHSAALGAGWVTYNGTSAPHADRLGQARPRSGHVDSGAFERNRDSGSLQGELPAVGTTTGITTVELVDAASFAAASVASSDSEDGAGLPAAAVSDTEPAAMGLTGHPRLWLSPERFAMMRAKGCLDTQGNPIPGCQKDGEWTYLDSELPTYWGEEAWHYAVAYIVSGNLSYANDAITYMNNQVATITSDEDRGQTNFLRISDTMRSVCIVYDWCYDLLSQTERNNYLAYINQLMNELWNPNTAPTHSWNGWGLEDPGNNFYYSFMIGTTYAALVTANDQNVQHSLPFRGTVYTDLLEFVRARIEQQVIPEHFNTWGDGGAWHEGNNYGLLTKRYILEMMLLLRDTGGIDYFQQTDFMKGLVYYHLYSMAPDFSMGYPWGDIPSETKPYDTALMLLATNAFRGSVESEYAQYFANNIETSLPWGWWQFVQPYGVLLRDPSIPERDWRQELPNSYHAKGGGWVNSRSGWGVNDVSVSFVCTNRIQQHQAQDQASFHIQKNGMQATNGNLHSSWGIYQMADAFNTLLIDGNGQAYGGDHNNIPELVRDIGFVAKFDAGSDFTYVVGDASDAYYTNAGQFGNGNTRLLDVFTRELVHVFPGYVIVYDRVTPRNSSHLPTWQLHTENNPTQSGNRIDATTGNGKLHTWVLLPTNHTIRIRQHPGGLSFGEATTISSYQTRVDPVTPQANHLLLHVLYVTDAADNAMPGVSRVTSQDGNMVGTKIEETSGNNFVIMFSTDPVLDVPIESVIYDVGYNFDARHFLFGLVPDMQYDVDVATTETGYQVSVSLGTEFRSSSSGTLRFDLRNIVEEERLVAGE